MKELSIEQKARAYDEAIERASKLRVQNPFDTVSQMMEHVFPELCESEDEKIRKALIRFHKSTIDIDGIKGDEIVSWLEKQGEPVSNDLEEAATKYARKQLSNPDYPTYNDEYEMECAFEAGAQWQKQQLIDKACEWLENHNDYICGGTNGVSWYNMQQLVNDFKKAMEE